MSNPINPWYNIYQWLLEQLDTQRIIVWPNPQIYVIAFNACKHWSLVGGWLWSLSDFHTFVQKYLKYCIAMLELELNPWLGHHQHCLYLINGPAVPTQRKLMRASLLHLSQTESNVLPINVLLNLPLLNNLYKEARTGTFTGTNRNVRVCCSTADLYTFYSSENTFKS